MREITRPDTETAFATLEKIRVAIVDANLKHLPIVGLVLSLVELTQLTNIFNPGGACDVTTTQIMGYPVLCTGDYADEAPAPTAGQYIVASPEWPEAEAAFWYFKIHGKLPSKVYVGAGRRVIPEYTFPVVPVLGMPANVAVPA